MSADSAFLESRLLEARARTLRMTRDLDGERLLGPLLAIVNPPLWEIGHVGWFQERWCLRMAKGGIDVPLEVRQPILIRRLVSSIATMTWAI